MGYRLVFERTAEKALKKKIRPDQAERVREALAALAEDPYPRNSRKLQNTENRRLRVGEYRVIYFVEEPEEAGDEPGTVYVLDVGHRQGIYG
ncbi:MAG: type II toxin-antitoxin system RelE/ParE family toxin [Rubrobacter sp.]|nr:type II toxin-antitoxin system RelE/ParE family toxin [Rubrobacter sp.]